MSNDTSSPSTQRFRSHALHAALRQWVKKLQAEKPDGLRDLDAQAREPYVRLRWVLRDFHARLDKQNPLLVSLAVLDSLNKQLGQLQPHWDQYRRNPAEQWQSLDNAIDGFVSALRGLPPSDGAGAWQEILEELRADMNGAIADAQTAIKALQNTAGETEAQFQNAQKQLEELTSEIQVQKTRLDQMLTQQSESFSKAEQDRVSQFTKAEQDRSAKFTEAQDQKKERFDTLIDEFEQARVQAVTDHQEMTKQHGDDFNASQAERQAQFEIFITEIKKATDDLTSTQTQQFEELITDATGRHEDLIAQLNSQLEKAVEIVGTIVKTTMSGTYKNVAVRELWNAWIMRVIALVMFLLMGGMVIWAVRSMDFSENGVDWGTFAFRLSLGFVFLIPGIYCAKEAGRHWNAERHNRRLALELATLDPFLVKLDEAKRKEIIEKKADEYFGQGSSGGADDEFPGLRDLRLRGDQLLKLAQQIAKIVRG